jgi:hypothetical protein
MADALTETLAFLTADAFNLPVGTTHSTAVPDRNITAIHVQFAWDGTPSDADNREDAVVRVTVWAPKGKGSDARNVAAGLRARFLAWSSANTWRVDRGAGRLPGVDSDLNLPFCTFTVSLVLRAVAAS